MLPDLSSLEHLWYLISRAIQRCPVIPQSVNSASIMSTQDHQQEECKIILQDNIRYIFCNMRHCCRTLGVWLPVRFTMNQSVSISRIKFGCIGSSILSISCPSHKLSQTIPLVHLLMLFSHLSTARSPFFLYDFHKSYVF